ncbi:MAG: homoserine O-succinyltransferase [Gemmatimonadota bacterium]|nr:homoserine O-succinyltransferase [Gemmatimonadota bacterium]
MTVLESVRVEPASTHGPPLPYELVGRSRAPVVVVLGGISADRHVASSAADPTPGWWEAQVGPGRPVDTNSCRVLGVDYLDGGRAPDGRPARVVTTHDQAAAIALLLDQLGVERVRAIVGASYGGMVALAFAERFAARVDQLVIVSAAHESHPMSTGLRSLQRRVVELGLEHRCGGEALAIARGIAMTTYRTSREFGERFDNSPTVLGEAEVSFEVERYLASRGARFAATFRPERFLALSLSMDLHRVDPAAVHTPATLVAAEGDVLVPEEQMRTLSKRLAVPGRLAHLPTIFGHDAFLKEPVKVGRILSTVLSHRVLS